MAYAPTVPARSGGIEVQTLRPRRRGIFRRLIDAIVHSQQRRAEFEIARYLRDRGGKLNDDAEREIERRFLLPQGNDLIGRMR